VDHASWLCVGGAGNDRQLGQFAQDEAAVAPGQLGRGRRGGGGAAVGRNSAGRWQLGSRPGQMVMRLGPAQFLVAMKYVLAMSPSTCAASMEVKPASLSICRAFCSPHIVPRPIPPAARETVMQCMHEMV
jgi:hypothetical protein